MKHWHIFTLGHALGLAFLIAWFGVEGLYVALGSSAVPLWSVPFNVGVVAPLVLIGALVCGLLLACWAHLAGVLGAGAASTVGAKWAGARAWLLDDKLLGGTSSQRSRRSAWLLASPLLVACWFGLGLKSGTLVMSMVKTSAYAHLTITALLLLGGLLLVILAPLIVVPIERVLALAGRWSRLGAPPPAVALGVLATGAGAGFVVAWVQFPDVMPFLPWNFALSPLVGLAFVIGAVYLVGASRRRSVIAAGTLTALVVAMGVFAAYLPVTLRKARAVFVEQTTVGATWYGVLADRLDYDGDGALHLYAGNDCAPRDASVNPNAPEIIGNDFDENCSGADLTIDRAQFSEGEPSHPRPEGVAKKPNIILVTTDALSHVQTTVGGYERDTTPNLAAFAERATVFEHGFALGPGTRLALPGLLAGVHNSSVSMKNGRIHPYTWADGTPTIASVLQQEGYRTVFVPGDDYFFPKRWGGYTQGFDVIDTSGYKDAKDKGHTAPEVTERALHHLREQQDKDKPLFLWVHYYDHHGPYKQPDAKPAFEGDRPVDLYDNELHFADRHWGKLFDAIEATWAPEEYLVVFTSDHGEVFSEHHPGKHHHGYSLHTDVLRVPFIVQGPRRRGERIEGLASHADVLPTVANVVGAKPRPEWIGESLVPALFDGQEVEKRVLFSQFYIPEAIKRGKDGFWKFGVRTLDYAYIEDLRKNTRSLVDWRDDPHLRDNLAERHQDTFEVYRYMAAKKLDELREQEASLSHLRKKKEQKKKKK